jgi:hypothetical protein
MARKKLLRGYHSTIAYMGPDGRLRPATATIDGVDIQDIVADLRAQLAGHETRLDEIYALAQKALTSVDPVQREAGLAAIQKLADIRSAGGKASGARRANKPWHAHARRFADDHPKLGPAALRSKVAESLDDNNIEGRPADPRTIDRFLTKHLER